MANINLEAETLPVEVATFAKKLAAGKKATTDWESGIALLARLPGWKVKLSVLPLPMRGAHDNNLEILSKERKNSPQRIPSPVVGAQGWDKQVHYAKAEDYDFKEKGLGILLDFAGRTYDIELVRRAVRIGEPKEGAVEEGVVYFEKFKDETVVAFQQSPSPRTTRMLIVGRIWYGTQGAVVTAPNGQSVAIFNEPKAHNEFGSDAFYTWGKKNGFYEAVKEALPGLVKPKTREEEDRERLATLDNTGVCAICDRRQKMHNINKKQPLLYDHGYNIPGWALRQGWAPRTGTCFGAGFPPYELSALALVKYLEHLLVEKVKLEQTLVKVRCLEVITRKEQGPYDRKTGEYSIVEKTYTPKSPEWADVKAKAVLDVERALKWTVEAITGYRERLGAWKRTQTYDEQKTGKELYRAQQPASTALKAVSAIVEATE